MSDPTYQRWVRAAGEAEEAVVRNVPGFEALIDGMVADPDMLAPAVRLMCPVCDRLIIDVRLGVDHNWHPFLQPAKYAKTLRPTRTDGVVDERPWDGSTVQVDTADDPLGAIATENNKKIQCRNKRCSYVGTYSAPTLLKLYAIAACVARQREIQLPH